MLKFIAVLALSLTGLLAWADRAQAAAQLPTNPTVSFSDADTAAYVVSTLNLVHTGTGQPLVPLAGSKYGVTRYAVWEDVSTNTFIIQLKLANGSNAGMLVYRLGWDKPYSYSRFTDRLGVPRSPMGVEAHFRRHPKRLIGSFVPPLP